MTKLIELLNSLNKLLDQFGKGNKRKSLILGSVLLAIMLVAGLVLAVNQTRRIAPNAPASLPKAVSGDLFSGAVQTGACSMNIGIGSLIVPSPSVIPPIPTVSANCADSNRDNAQCTITAPELLSTAPSSARMTVNWDSPCECITNTENINASAGNSKLNYWVERISDGCEAIFENGAFINNDHGKGVCRKDDGSYNSHYYTQGGLPLRIINRSSGSECSVSIKVANDQGSSSCTKQIVFPSITPSPTPTVFGPTPTIPNLTPTTGGVTVTPSEVPSTTLTVTPTSTVPASPTPTIPSSGRPEDSGTATWTYIMYIMSNNNLSSLVNAAISRLQARPDSTFLNVVILYGSGCSTTTIKKYVRCANQSPTNVTETRYGSSLVNPSTLASFLNDAKNICPPTDYYSLEVMDHGNGAIGLGWQGCGGRDQGSYLKREQLIGALSGRHFDILYLDACLMGLTENLDALQWVADFIISNQNEGWTSQALLDAYSQLASADFSPEEFARAIADCNFTRMCLPTPGIDRVSAISVVSSALMAPVRTALDTFSGKLKEALGDNCSQAKSCITQARNQTQKFDSSADFSIGNTDAYLDLYDFADKIISNCSSLFGGLAISAEALKFAINNAVISIQHQNGRITDQSQFLNLDNSHGLSIYFPPRTAIGRSQPVAFFNEFQIQSWSEFLLLFANSPCTLAQFISTENVLGESEESLPSLGGLAPMLDAESGRPFGKIPDLELACKACPDGTFASKGTVSYNCNKGPKNLMNGLGWVFQRISSVFIKLGENKMYSDYNCDGKIDLNDFRLWWNNNAE